MKLSRATIALYVGLVFASGVVLGFFSNRLYSATTVSASKTGSGKPTAEEFRKWVNSYYPKRLQLTGDQVQQMNLILDESQAQVNAIHARMDPEIRCGSRESNHAHESDADAHAADRVRQNAQGTAGEKQQQRRAGRSGGPGF